MWEAAHGGMLFLDEIRDLSVAAQVKVLRVLQENVVRRVGSTEDKPVDVRVVAATNVNLLEKVHASTFRRDLYYRLHILHVTVAPLREREGDTLLILDYLMRKLCAEWNLGEPPTISRDAKDKLLAYSWPGNIRELESVVTRALSLHAGATELHAVHFELSESEVGIPPDILPLFVEKGRLTRMKNRAEDAMIRWALDVSQGNHTAAAKLLGIHRNTLIGKIRKYQLQNR